MSVNASASASANNTADSAAANPDTNSAPTSVEPNPPTATQVQRDFRRAKMNTVAIAAKHLIAQGANVRRLLRGLGAARLEFWFPDVREIPARLIRLILYWGQPSIYRILVSSDLPKDPRWGHTVASEISVLPEELEPVLEWLARYLAASARKEDPDQLPRPCGMPQSEIGIKYVWTSKASVVFDNYCAEEKLRRKRQQERREQRRKEREQMELEQTRPQHG
ncbi:MAG: hypothetical protein NT069_32820 [Planctomycetota bacterium]|nr:hypothetical protein [Planctomycetota bacterium]